MYMILSLVETRTRWSYIVYNMSADKLTRQGTQASIANVLNRSSPNNVLYRLSCEHVDQFNFSVMITQQASKLLYFKRF